MADFGGKQPRWKWSGAFSPKAQIVPSTGQGSLSDSLARERYLASLRSGAPMQWMSDHLKESTRLRGSVYVAIKVLGDQAGASQVKCYQWHPEARMAGDKAAKKPLPYDHNLSRLIRKPNGWETWNIIARRIVQQLCLTGTNLLWRVDDGYGKPSEMWSIPTGTYQPVAPSASYPLGAYRVMPWFPGPLAMIPGAMSAGGVVVPTQHMIRTMHPHPLVQMEGQSPLAACELALDSIEAIDRARMSRMQRQVAPSAVAKTDPEVAFLQGDELTRAREELHQLMGGPDKAGRVAFLPPGIELEPWGQADIEIGWIESWSQLIDFVLSIFGITKSLAFMGEDGSFAQLYAALRQFNLFTLTPLLSLIADSINLQLTWPFFGDDVFVELEPGKITNEEERDRGLEILGKFSGMTVNEMRQSLGWEPVEEEWGKERVGKAMQQPGGIPIGGNAGGAVGHDHQFDWFTGGKQPRQEAPETQRARPENGQGSGSLGSRMQMRKAYEDARQNRRIRDVMGRLNYLLERVEKMPGRTERRINGHAGNGHARR